MSLKSKPTAKKKKQKKKSERQKEKTVYKRILPQSAPNDLVKENTKKTETEQSFYGVQLFTHTWALNGSEYRTSTISVSQSTLTHLHAHSHRNFKHTCTRRREERRGFGARGGAAWAHTTLDHWSRHKTGWGWEGNRGSRGGVGGLQQDDTTARGHSRNMSNSGGGVADRDTARYASVVESQFFFYSKRWTHPMARGEKKLLVQ